MNPKLRTFCHRAWPLGLFLVLTVLTTWPHGDDLRTRLPGQNDAVVQDALLNVWTLQQGIQNVLTDRGLFESNAFWPHKLTLSFSDHLMGWWPFALVLSMFTDNYVLIFNILLLSTFFLTACGGYLVTLQLTASQKAAVIGGVIVGFCPFRFSQYGHFAGLSMQWSLFAYYFLLRFLDSNRWQDSLAALFLVVLQTLCSGIYGAYFCAFVGVFIFVRTTFRKNWSLKGAAVFGGHAIALFVLLLPYYWPNIVLKRQLGFERTQDENVRLAADVLTVLTPPPNSMIYGNILTGMPPGEGQFPGLIVVVLACFGACQLWRLKNGRETVIVFGVSGFIAWMLSLGPQIKWNAQPLMPGPYALLMELVPVFGVLRMSTRFGAFMMLSLAVLAAFGVREWLKRNPDRQQFHFAMILAIVCIEYTAPPPLGPAPDSDGMPPVYEWMTAQEDNKVVIELPYTHSYGDAFAMYYSTKHGMNILNGYSSFTPPEGMIAVLGLGSFPAPESVRLLQATGADWVLVHQEILNRRLASTPPGLTLVARFDADEIYAIKTNTPELKPISQVSPTDFELASGEHPDALRHLRTPDGHWPPSGFRKADTALTVRLKEPQRIRGVELTMRPFADLFPSEFLISTSADSASESREVKTLLPEFYVSARESPRSPRLRILFAEHVCEEIIIRPALRPGLKAWPIRQIHLLK